MSIRAAISSDASALAAISIEVWIGTYLKRGVSKVFADYALDAFQPAAFTAMMQDPKQWILVSENAEGIDGFIRVTQNSAAPIPNGPDCEIATFYVQPRHHGKGIGTSLLQAALTGCTARGISQVWLATNAENDPAIGFYQSCGFSKVGETHFRIDGQGYLNNVYTRPTI